jgi:hypothetical protein
MALELAQGGDPVRLAQRRLEIVFSIAAELTRSVSIQATHPDLAE